MNRSVWYESVELPAFPTLKEDLHTDVLIVGGGIAGLLCAYELARAGISYTLIESNKICNGVSGNTTAKVTSQHGCIYSKLIREFGMDFARGYWEANEAAVVRLGSLCQEIDCDYEKTKSYIYATGSRAVLDEEMSTLESLQIPAEFTDRTALPFQVNGAICFPGQAQFHPLRFVSAIVKGMHIYEHTVAREFIGNTVITDSGKITADKVIIATHFPIINKHGGYFLKMYQQRSYVLALKNAVQVSGMYRDANDNGLSFRNAGDMLLIGGGSHRTGKKGSGWSDLEKFARRYYPDAREAGRWATQDCMTLDAVPYIGQYSRKTPNLYVATGFNKWGMTSSMVAATILCDMVQGKKNPYSSVFDPSRTSMRPQLLYNILESSVNLLTPTRPRCPHLGCALKWNPQEHSWDCPCHGSRFMQSGKLLNNPATDDLKNE